MFAVLTPAMAALMPIFIVIEVVLAIAEFCKALATLDPVAIAEATEKFAQAVDKLLGIVPQASFPLMIVGLLQLMIDMIVALIDFIEELALYQNQIALMKDYAQREGLEDMLQSALCLEANLETQLEYFNSAIGACAGFMAIMELLGQFIGVDLSVDVSVSEGAPLSDIVDELAVIRDTLQTLMDSIPVV